MTPPPELRQLALIPSLDLDRLRSQCSLLSSHARSPNTIRAYAAGWRAFELWCARAGSEALPASAGTIALFATDQLVNGLKLKTVEARLMAIVDRHKAAGVGRCDLSDAWRVVAGARRLHRHLHAEGKQALRVEQLTEMMSKLAHRGRPRDLRNRAILGLGFASALRRSELASLELADIELSEQGVSVRLRKSKTDQIGAGRTIGVYRAGRADVCPLLAVEDWVHARGNEAGPLFVRFRRGGYPAGGGLSGAAICEVVKECVSLAGLDPREYGGHSLRAGLVTTAFETGADSLAIMQRTGHTSLQVLRTYIRPASAFVVDPLANI